MLHQTLTDLTSRKKQNVDITEIAPKPGLRHNEHTGMVLRHRRLRHRLVDVRFLTFDL
jgi:hypothetical protein